MESLSMRQFWRGSVNEWQKIRDSENNNWGGELDILSDYKHQVNECLQLLNDGTIEQMLIAEEIDVD